MKYFYIINRTNDTFIKELKEKPTYHILSTYKLIKKKKNNNWGIFLFDEGKLIGYTEANYTKESKINILYITHVYLDEEYRGKKLCNELLKRTIIKHEQNKGRPNLIKITYAEGITMLKCSLRTFKELDYKIKIYQNQYDQIISNKNFDTEEDIKKLKNISYKKAIEIEEKNISGKYDIWYSLFFYK